MENQIATISEIRESVNPVFKTMLLFLYINKKFDAGKIIIMYNIYYCIRI